MGHPIYRVTSVDALGGYRLRVGFDDGTTQLIDLGAILEGELYGERRDPALFAGSRGLNRAAAPARALRP